MLHRRSTRGIWAISLGVSLLLAQVLPVHVMIFFTGVTLIVLGWSWMKCC